MIRRRNFGKWVIRNGILVPFVSPAIIKAVTILGGAGANRFVVSGGGSSIAYVGITSTDADNDGNTTIAATRTCTAGNLLIACISFEDSSTTVASVASTSDTWTARTLVAHSGSPPTVNAQLYYAANIVGGSKTVTVTFNNSVAFASLQLVEVSGCSTTVPFDVEPTAGGSSGTSTAASSGNMTTGTANEFLITLIKNYNGNTETPQASWTEIHDNGTSNGCEVQYRIVSSTGTYAGSGTVSGSSDWACVAAGFK